MTKKPKLCISSENMTRKTSGVISSHEERESLLFFWINTQMPLPVFVEKKDLYFCPRVRRCLFCKLRNEKWDVRCSRNTYISAYVAVTARNLILKSMSELELRPRIFTHLTIKSLLDFGFFAGDFCKKSMLFSIFNISAYFVSGMRPS